VAIVCVGLGGVSFAQPSEHEASRSVGYQQTGAFDYSANSPVPGVYDGDVAATGEPVFRRLTSEVLVAFSYRFVTESPHLVGGTHRLTAVISDTAGWRRTIELQPETAFSGDGFRSEGVLDLTHLYALVNYLEAETGVRRDHYTVAVVPEVAIEGMVAGQELRDRFAPRLGFRLDQNQFQALSAGPREADPRAPSQSGSVEVPHVEPASLSLLSLRLTVADARKFAAAGLLIALGGAVALVLLTARSLRADELSRIRARFGPLLVSVVSDDPPAGRVVEAEAIEDLVRIAERSGSMILHHTAGDVHSYLVHHGDSTYRYQAQARPARARAPSAEALRSTQPEA